MVYHKKSDEVIGGMKNTEESKKALRSGLIHEVKMNTGKDQRKSLNGMKRSDSDLRVFEIVVSDVMITKGLLWLQVLIC